MIVVDASAALEVARKTDCGEELLAVMDGGEKIIAPSIFFAEAANATWKHAVFGSLAENDRVDFFKTALGVVDEFIPDSELLPEAMLEAIAVKHSVYDMLYFVLARRNGAQLVTCDRKLAKLCEDNSVDCAVLLDM